MSFLNKDDVKKMSYVQLLASIHEVNRPPGGKDSIRRIVQNTFLTKDSKVLDVGCNTGYSAFEIAHLVKCHITGIDISPDMINTARQFKRRNIDSQQVDFLVADGMNLPFADGSFDLVISGGSTAFINDKIKALKEYTRVTKTWGFVADINFYYKQKAPKEIIAKLNSAMDINIEPWGKDYWMNLYKETELELYYTHFNDVYVPSDDEITTYCTEMSASVNADADTQCLIKERLIELMSLFTENHRYLSYGIFVLRKRNAPEQISLFGS